MDFDVVIPKGNEKDFIDMALRLHYKAICFLSEDLNYKKPSTDRIKVYSAYMAKNTSEISRARKNFDFIFAEAGRGFFESKIDYILNSEISDRKDSVHYRSTILNQVHAKLAKANNISIVFNFSNLLDKERNKILGRMMQNARIVEKYGLKHSTFSMAKDPYFMRSSQILSSFSRTIKNFK